MSSADDPKINGRTHEPALREVVADLDGLRDLMIEKIRAIKELMDERDKYYAQRDRDRQAEVERALAASDKQTAAAFTASKEATREAKVSQDQYNVTHNDLLRKLADQMPRVEIEGRLRTLEGQISDTKTSFSRHGGMQAGTAQGVRFLKTESQANVAILIAVVSVLVVLWRALTGH